jgi:hypothetical protein
VNVTLVSAHTGLAEGAIITCGVNIGFTVIVIAEEVADAGLAHVAFDTITQATTSPFTGVYVNV